MDLAARAERIFTEQTEGLSGHPVFRRLESGAAGREEYATLLANLFVTHHQSPKVMAFLFALAPPAGAESIRHNLLEEMGLEEGGVGHPELLGNALAAAGFDPRRMRELEARSLARIRAMACDPLLYGTLMETGLAVLLEAAAFEWMLSRLAERIGDILSARLGLDRAALDWFYHHGEVDARHAREALQVIAAYAAYYGIGPAEAENILEITFRGNVFQRQYLAGL